MLFTIYKKLLARSVRKPRLTIQDREVGPLNSYREIDGTTCILFGPLKPSRKHALEYQSTDRYDLLLYCAPPTASIASPLQEAWSQVTRIKKPHANIRLSLPANATLLKIKSASWTAKLVDDGPTDGEPSEGSLDDIIIPSDPILALQLVARQCGTAAEMYLRQVCRAMQISKHITRLNFEPGLKAKRAVCICPPSTCVLRYQNALTGDGQTLPKIWVLKFNEYPPQTSLHLDVVGNQPLPLDGLNRSDVGIDPKAWHIIAEAEKDIGGTDLHVTLGSSLSFNQSVGAQVFDSRDFLGGSWYLPLPVQVDRSWFHLLPSANEETVMAEVHEITFLDGSESLDHSVDRQHKIKLVPGQTSVIEWSPETMYYRVYVEQRMPSSILVVHKTRAGTVEYHPSIREWLLQRTTSRLISGPYSPVFEHQDSWVTGLRPPEVKHEHIVYCRNVDVVMTRLKAPDIKLEAKILMRESFDGDLSWAYRHSILSIKMVPRAQLEATIYDEHHLPLVVLFAQANLYGTFSLNVAQVTFARPPAYAVLRQNSTWGQFVYPMRVQAAYLAPAPHRLVWAPPEPGATCTGKFANWITCQPSSGTDFRIPVGSGYTGYGRLFLRQTPAKLQLHFIRKVGEWATEVRLEQSENGVIIPFRPQYDFHMLRVLAEGAEIGSVSWECLT